MGIIKGGFRRGFYSAFIGIAVLIFTVVWLAAGGKFVNEKGWQAVFLENSQVYFGRLAIEEDFYVLKRVYYLQSEENSVDKLGQASTSSVDDSRKENLTKLVKLGKEVHGPEDTMFIEKSKVLFWENLKEESSVVRSIKEYESGL